MLVDTEEPAEAEDRVEAKRSVVSISDAAEVCAIEPCTSLKSSASLKSSYRNQRTGTLTLDHVISAKKVHADLQFKADIRFLVMPWSRFLTVWRTVMVVVVLWAVIFAPFELAFSWWTPSTAFDVVSRFVDTFCIADMFMTFFIVTIKHGRLVTKRKAIAKAYMTSWFWCDLLTNIPWDLLIHSSSGKSRKVVKVLKLPKVFRLTRLLRVAREEAHTLGTFFTLSGMLLLAHYFSCLWTLLLIDCEESEQCPDIIDTYAEGLSVGTATLTGSDAWLRFIVEGWHFDWQSPPGVGVELAAIVTCLTGLCAMGMLFANIARAMDKQDSHTRKFNERLRNVQAASNQHALSKDIYSRARRHFHYVWSCGSDASRELLADQTLSIDLRRELAFSFYGDLLRKVPFLENAEANLLKQLCRYAIMEVFSPQDNIIMSGESGDELFFLVVGSVTVRNPKDGAVLRTLDEGSFFGEVALFNPESCHGVNVKASTFGWLLIISRDNLVELCDDALLEEFKKVAMERVETELVTFRKSGHLGSRSLAPRSSAVIEDGQVARGDVASSGKDAKQRLSLLSLRSETSSKCNSQCQFDVEAFASHMEAKIDLWAGSLEKRLGALEVRGDLVVS